MGDDGVSATVIVRGSKHTGGGALAHSIKVVRLPDARDAAKKVLRSAGYKVLASASKDELG